MIFVIYIKTTSHIRLFTTRKSHENAFTIIVISTQNQIYIPSDLQNVCTFHITREMEIEKSE